MKKGFKKSFRIGLILIINCIYVYFWMILISRIKNFKRMNKYFKNECINIELKIKIDDCMNK